MKTLRVCAMLLVALGLSGCYAAKVDTGRTPSTKVISKKFASCWIYGLVPPATIQTSTECPDGVALVETQHSFLNYIVGAITFGIYTPIQIVVTCAEPGKTSMDPAQELTVPPGASAEVVRETFGRAATRAVESGKPVVVHLN